MNICKNNCIKLLTNVELQARSENIIPVQCNKALSMVTADFDPSSYCGIPGIYTKRRRIIPTIDGIFQISLLNTTAKPVNLKASQGVGFLMNVNETVATVHQFIANNVSTIDTSIIYSKNLSSDEKSRIVSLISEYSDIFAPNPKKPTIVKAMEHRIITNETQPINHKPYRIPHAWHTEIEQHILEMLRNGIIHRSSSTWNAPVILVRKKMVLYVLYAILGGSTMLLRRTLIPYHIFAML